MDYRDTWDLTTVPEPEWNREHGRRTRAKGPAVTNQKLKGCKQCGTMLNSTERRKPCTNCGFVHPRKAAK